MDQDHHSSDSPIEPWVDPALEARIVALILGESSEFEEAELLAAIDAQPELKAFYDRISGTHRALQSSESPSRTGAGPEWKLPAAKREALVEHFRNPVEDPAAASPPLRSGSQSARLRTAPWLAIAAALVLLALASLPLTLSRRALKVAGEAPAERMSEGSDLDRIVTFENSDLALLGDVEGLEFTPPERRLLGFESLLLADASSTVAPLGEAEPLTTWGRYAGRKASDESAARGAAAASGTESFAIAPGATDDWYQGIAAARGSVTSRMGSPDQGLDGAPADPGATAGDGSNLDLAFGQASRGRAGAPIAGGEVVAGTNGRHYANDTRSPEPSSAPAPTDVPADRFGKTATTDDLSTAAVQAPEVSEAKQLAMPEPAATERAEFGNVAQLEDARGTDRDFALDATTTDSKLATLASRLATEATPSADPSPLVTGFQSGGLAPPQVPADGFLPPATEPQAPAGGQRDRLTYTADPQLAFQFGTDPTRPGTPAPALNRTVEASPAGDAEALAGGTAAAPEADADPFASDAGVIAGYAIIDEVRDLPSGDPASPSAFFDSEAEGIVIAEAEVELRRTLREENLNAGAGGFGGGGGAGAAVGQREFDNADFSDRARFEPQSMDAAQGQAVADLSARLAKAEPPSTPTLGIDFGWDIQAGATSKFSADGGDTLARDAGENYAFKTRPGLAESDPSGQLAEGEVSRGLLNQLKEVDTLTTTTSSLTGTASVGRLFDADSADGELSKHEHLVPAQRADVNGGIDLDDAIAADGTVRMLSLAGDEPELRQAIRETLQGPDSEELDRSGNSRSSRTTSLGRDTSRGEGRDRELAEVTTQWGGAGQPPMPAITPDPAPDAPKDSGPAAGEQAQGTGPTWSYFEDETLVAESRQLARFWRSSEDEIQRRTATRAILPEELPESQLGEPLPETAEWEEQPLDQESVSADARPKWNESIPKLEVGSAENLVAAKNPSSRSRYTTSDPQSALTSSLARPQEEQGSAGEGFRSKAEPDLSLETLTSAEPFSTFSLNVSDVSFRLARTALLENSSFPDSSKVRVEEFVNAFDYGDPPPSLREKVACNIDQSTHPFLQQRNLMRISMRTAAEGRSASQPLHLTILLDRSGSMERADREESVLRTMQALSTHLGPADRVSAIAFARQPHLIAEQLSGDRAGELVDLVAATPSEGGTNLEEALLLADTLATRQFEDGAINRIVLITDGAANLGDASPESLKEMVVAMRQRGIAFDACGVGANGFNDTVLEALTRKGDGRYYFLDRPDDADDQFVRKLAGALRPAAKNVKVQVKFNPDRVTRYRLAGFEKHRLNKEDFRDDKVDAAEMAAAESGNALYQIEANPQGSGDVGEVSVRFLDTGSGQMVERSWPIPYLAKPPRLEDASPSMQLAATAGLLGEKLKGAPSSGAIELSGLVPITNQLRAEFTSNQEVQQLIKMVETATSLTGG